MKYTYNIQKSGFNFVIHSREYSDENGEPISDNPTLEFEVLDDLDYSDAIDFFSQLEEVTTAADNFDLVAGAISYLDYHPIDSHTQYDADLVDHIDTAIEMVVNWGAFEVNSETVHALQMLSENYIV